MRSSAVLDSSPNAGAADHEHRLGCGTALRQQYGNGNGPESKKVSRR
jgi:hypothetical protein